MDLAQDEKDLYQRVWNDVDGYERFSPGEKYLPLFLQMLGDTTPASYTMPGDRSVFKRKIRVLDAGTGSGKGALALEAQGFDVACCDLTEDGLVPEARRFKFYSACLWNNLNYLGRFDHIYCCDVLEHIPPQLTMLVVLRLLSICKQSAFFSISLTQDEFGAWVGRPLHQTVMPFLWWKDALNAVGVVAQCRDLLQNGVYLVRPRS